MSDAGRILLDGEDITFHAGRPQPLQVIGRLFQDPLRGTAPHMTIEENLALAYLRAAHGNAVLPHHGQGPRALPRPARAAGHGAGGPDETARRPALGRPAPGADAFDGDAGPPEAAAARRAHGGPGPRHGGKGAGADAEHRGGESHHLPDGDAQHDAGALAGQPHADDGGRRHRARRRGRGARRHDSGGSR